jgi:hypothetical protein
MSFKDLGSKNVPPRVDTPEEAELRARAAARHKAKEAKAARWEEQRAAKKEPQPGGAPRGEPAE